MTVEITAPVDISALPEEVKNRIIMAAIPVVFAAGDGFIGVFEEAFDGDTDTLRVLNAELDALCEQINALFKDAPTIAVRSIDETYH
ncbi:hypothetical protein ACBP93_08635 [Paenalcaligenes hominis]|uniref:hypothetical protein n=1 Tax=Paenalcaligenes hominis TaxID=643674 RepID=UPI003525FAF5